ELQELTRIYVERGLDTALAEQVARQLTERNALEAHMRDELGLTSELEARPVQAAIASAASFTAGAAFPLLLVLLLPLAWVAPGV
ncbi:VIT1/CCC1 transporter family protein, partial [Enterococcus faecalis]|uniref:VIT1/CCC1 transporter family protein n=1 Tax=Enterococcus faecalis TaxID=1351 RepID=UPI00403F0498